jgi:hypothetical protein
MPMSVVTQTESETCSGKGNYAHSLASAGNTASASATLLAHNGIIESDEDESNDAFTLVSCG